MTLGERIRGARLRDGHSQETFAHKLGVSVQTVSRWERGASVPKRHAQRLSEVTGIPVAEMRDESDDDDVADAAPVGVSDNLALLLEDVLERMLSAARSVGPARDRRSTDKPRRHTLESAAAGLDPRSFA
jgi:transcriptional regulator with XRE-family HTH domain